MDNLLWIRKKILIVWNQFIIKKVNIFTIDMIESSLTNHDSIKNVLRFGLRHQSNCEPVKIISIH